MLSLLIITSVKRLKILIFLSYFLASLNLLCGQESSFQIKNFTKKNYKAENQNWSVTKGADNYIYVANNAGLLVFDGINWIYNTSPNIENVRSVKVDGNTGRIYTSGYREIGYWQWDSLGLLQYHSLNHLAEEYYSKNEEFWKIEIISDSILFQSFSGIFIYTKNKFEVLRPSGFINTISLIEDEIYVHILNNGIYLLKDGKTVPFLVNQFFNDKLIRFLIKKESDNYLIGTANKGIFEFDGQNITPVFEEFSDYFRTNTINRGDILNNEIIVVGTILDGLIGLSFDGKLKFMVNEENGLQNNTVLGLSVTENNIWLALDRGISFIDLQTDPSFEVHKPKETGAVYSAAIYNNKFYLGTNQGLFAKDTQGDDNQFKLVDGTQGQVWDCSIIEDNLFIGHNSGTFVIDNDGINKISNVSGGFCIIDNNFEVNTLIQSTYSNLIYYKRVNGKWQIEHSISNFIDLIRYIELDHLNNLWAGHMRRAIYKLVLNDKQDSVIHTKYYGKNSVFGKEFGVNVFKIENRIIFTTGEKIYTYDDINDSIVPYVQVNENIGKYAKSHRVVNAKNHFYWFITHESIGLFEFQLNKIVLVKEYSLELFGYNLIEGYENVIPLSGNKAILCLEDGYAILNADTTENSRYEINSIEIKPIKIVNYGRKLEEERLLLNKKHFILPYTKNNLLIEYAFPYYTTHNIKYKYYIEGLDNTWSEPFEKPVFELNRIPAGEYKLKVVAENGWGEKSVPHEIYFKVLSPWYSSTLAWVIYSIFVTSIVFFVRFFSVKRIKEREKKKREQKEQELIKLRNQNLRAELSYKSRELANSTMSIIQKNEFLFKLKDLLKNQKTELGTRYPDKYYDKLVEKIDNNMSHGDDWKIFETNIEQAHEDFTQKLINTYPQLSHSDIRLCTYLRMNLTSKEIAPLMHISVRGVENHRYRIRKKLNLDSEVNLTNFILGFKA